MAQIQTVKIKAQTDDGFILINRSDFDPEIHTEFSEESEVKTRVKTPAKKD